MFGDYVCVAQNKLGSLRKVVTLSEGAKPAIPKVRVHKIEQDAAVLEIEENKAELFLDIIGFEVEVKEKPAEWSNATVIRFHRSKCNGIFSNTFYYRVRDAVPSVNFSFITITSFNYL